MKKTLIEFGKSSAIQIPEEQLIAVKGGRRRRFNNNNNNNNNNDGDPGCPPDYD